MPGQPSQVDVAECDLRHVAEDVCDGVSRRGTATGSCSSARETPSDSGARTPCARLENLLTNAVEYGEPGAADRHAAPSVGHRMILSRAQQRDDHPDRGPGQALPAVPSDRSRRGERERGWGLGLTLVRGIVEAHRGLVKVESYPKDGTTFTVDLPVDERERARDAK